MISRLSFTLRKHEEIANKLISIKLKSPAGKSAGLFLN
jgi:hypothetical protein